MVDGARVGRVLGHAGPGRSHRLACGGQRCRLAAASHNGIDESQSDCPAGRARSRSSDSASWHGPLAPRGGKAAQPPSRRSASEVSCGARACRPARPRQDGSDRSSGPYRSDPGGSQHGRRVAEARGGPCQRQECSCGVCARCSWRTGCDLRLSQRKSMPIMRQTGRRARPREHPCVAISSRHSVATEIEPHRAAEQPAAGCSAGEPPGTSSAQAAHSARAQRGGSDGYWCNQR